MILKKYLNIKADSGIVKTYLRNDDVGGESSLHQDIAFSALLDPRIFLSILEHCNVKGIAGGASFLEVGTYTTCW